MLLGKIFELDKRLTGFACRNRLARQFRGAAKIFCDSRDGECGSGVGNDDVESRTRFASKKRMNDFGVFLRGAAAEGFKRGARKAEIFGGDGESPQIAVADFGDLRFTGQRDFVEATGAVDNESAVGAEFGES